MVDSCAKDSQILVIVGTLIEAAGDRNHAVREVVAASLRRIAMRHANFVLKNMYMYRMRNLKLAESHLIVLLQTMEQICKQHLPDVDGDVVLQLIEFSVEEMIQSVDNQPDQQMPASGILVALGQAYCNEVMGGLLKQFQPGVVPHYAILHTMGALASANIFGIVPFVKATLGTMLPMLGMLRSDAMKHAFSYALGRFSDAVSDYLANIDHAPDPTVKREAFSSEITIAYDVLANTWIHTREPKVCEAVLQAIAAMFPLLPREKVPEEVPRLVPVLLGLYRRNVDPYPVTQCLSAVLPVALAHNRSTVEPLLDNIQNIMFDLVCISPDYAQPATAKNHCEVLRCFDCIAGHFLDKVIELVIQQLKNNNDRERVKALFVITHLVNSSENLIRSRITNLVTALRSMLGEHNVKVKKVLLKAIVAFAYRGYLDGFDGREFVEFIVKHSFPHPVPAMGKDLSDGSLLEELQGTCANTLYLLVTTVPQLESTLWPILLHCLLTSQYTPACSHLARCLVHLATKRKDQVNFTENSAKLAQEVTCPIIVLARCLALLGCPLKSDRGTYILQFLGNYASNVSRHLKPLWEKKIPELVSHIDNCMNTWDTQVWEDLVLEFLSATLMEMDEEKWTMGLGVKLMEHIPLYQSYPEERGMLYKCLAVTVCHTTDEQFINHKLDIMLSSMRHNSVSESKACARAVGICTRNHLDLVLLKLEKLGKEELTRKSSRLLGFMKDVKHESEVERVRLTLLLCYGEVALETSGTQLMPRLEQHGIVQWVLQQLQTAKEASVREVSLITLRHIAEALHPNRNTLHIILESRSEILNQTLHQLRPQYSNISLNSRRLELYPIVLHVAKALVKLPPSLAAEERVSILKTCFDRVYSAAAVVAGDSSPEESPGDVSSSVDVGWANHISLILDCLGSLVQELLLDSVSPATLDDIFTLLEPWLIKKNSHQRAASIKTLHSVLQCYMDNVNFGYEAPSKFSQSGLILGRVVPRCTDSSMLVRQEAIDCVRLVLCLAALYEGHMPNHDNDHASDLLQVRMRIQTEDPDELFKVTNELGKVICTKLPHFQLIHFLESLLDGLVDVEPCCSSGASVVLNVLLKSHGGELYHQVNDILYNILERLVNVQCIQTRMGCVQAVRTLAHHHPKAVVTGLINQPLPFEMSVVECWAVLAQDPVLSAIIIEQFLQLMNNMALYNVQADRDKLKIATLQPLAAISAMHEMFRLATMQEIAVKRFPELFSVLLVALGCYIGTAPPVCTPQRVKGKKDNLTFIPNRNAYKLIPARVAVEALKSFLLCSQCEHVAEVLLQYMYVDAADSLVSFTDMVPALTKALCSRMPPSMPRLVTCLSQYGTSTVEPQRIVVAAFYAELVSLNANGQAVLLDSIVNNLLNCLNDPSPVVRQLCLKGLSSLSQLSQEQNHHCQPVLSALIQGLDDHDSNNNIPLEAMRGFSQMLQVVDVEHVQGIQVSVALRVKPFFENESPNVREAAFHVFGDLAKYGGTNSKAFQEQVAGNFVCLLLHLDDSSKTVVKACKYALRQASPLLGGEKINTMIHDHLIDAGNLHYPDFMADLVKIIVEELPEITPNLLMNALVYIKSSWPTIRGNAAMFIGHLYGSLPDGDVASKVPMDTVCARLIQLLQDDDQGVRAKVAKALSYLVMV